MSKISLIVLVALQIGMAGSAFAGPHNQYNSFSANQEQALIDRVGPTEGGQR